jgi:predicted RNase H-like HicB family nuclease
MVSRRGTTAVRIITLTALLAKDDDGWVGYVAELLGVSVQGRTKEETLERLSETARLHMEANAHGIAERFGHRCLRREPLRVSCE